MPIYLANDKYNATLTQTYTVGDNTLYVDKVPNNVPTIVVAEYGTNNETIFEVTGKTTNSLTGVTRLRGANVNLNIGSKITCVNNEEFINQVATFGAFSIEHNPDGTHNTSYVITPSAIQTLTNKTIILSNNNALKGKKTDTNVLDLLSVNTNNAIVVGNNTAGLVNRRSIISGTDGTPVVFNLSNGHIQTFTLTGNKTLSVSNVSVGDVFIIILKQDSTGSRTVTWWSGISWTDGVTPTLTTTANKYDVFGFICISSGSYLGFTVGQNL